MSSNTAPVNRQVNIYINQASAQAAYDQLKAKQDKLTDAINKGTAAGKDMTKQMEQLAQTKDKMDTLSKQMSGELAPSFNQVGTQVKSLAKDLKNMSENTPAYAQKFQEYQKANKVFQDMQASMKGVSEEQSLLGQKFSAIATGVATGEIFVQLFESVKEKIADVIKENAKLSDSLAEVADANKMSDQEVTQFYNNLKQIDTRTSTEQLNEFAVTAGQLGTHKEDLLDFVKAMDEVVVTLGKKIGGDPQQFIKDLVQQYKTFNNVETVTSKQLLEIGNAFQVMSNQGAASAQFIVGFTGKMMGMSKELHITQAESMGLASGLYNMGIRSEGAVAGVIKVFQQMGTDTPKYAKIAGMAAQDFADLMANKPVQALLAVTKGLAGNNKAFGEIAENFKDSQDGGARIANTLALIGQSGDKLVKSMDQAKEAMSGTGEITDAFSKKNDNLAANLAKIGKQFKEIWLDGSIAEGFNGIISWFGELTGAIDRTEKAYNNFIERQKQTTDLSEQVKPLLDTYERLKNTANKNTDQQKELKDTIEAIAKIIPSAATGFDEYGQAVDLNTARVKQYIDLQQQISRVQNADAIKQFTDKLKKLKDEQGNSLTDLENYSKGLKTVLDSYDKSNQQAVDFYTRMIANEQSKLSELNDRIAGTQALLDKLGANYQKIGGQLSKDLGGVFGENSIDALQGMKPKAPADTASEKGKINTPVDEAKIEAAKNLAAQIAQINADVAAMSKSQDELEIQRVKDKYNNIYRQTVKLGSDIAQLRQSEAAELDLLYKKQFTDRSGKEYDDSLKANSDFFNKQKQLTAQAYNDGTITKEQYNAKLRSLEVEEIQSQITIAQDYAPMVKKAADDTEKLKTQALMKGISDREMLEAKTQQDKTKSLQLDVAIAPKGSKKQLGAQKALLQDQYDKDPDNKDPNSELAIKNKEKLNDDLEKADSDYQVSWIHSIAQMAQQGQQLMGEYFQYLNQQDQQRLQADQQAADHRKQILKDELDNKQLTTAEYNAKVKDVDKQLALEQYKAQLDAFNRNKALSITKLLINEAEAIGTITAQWAGLPPVEAALAIGAAALIAGEIAIVASSKPPAPPQFGTGGILPDGPSHAAGGLNLVNPQTNQVIANTEGGEPILSKQTYKNNTTLVNDLMRSGGKKINYSRVSDAVAVTTAAPAAASQNNAKMMKVMDDHTKALNEFNKQAKRGFKANLYYNDIDQKNKEWQQLKNESVGM